MDFYYLILLLAILVILLWMGNAFLSTRSSGTKQKQLPEEEGATPVIEDKQKKTATRGSGNEESWMRSEESEPEGFEQTYPEPASSPQPASEPPAYPSPLEQEEKYLTVPVFFATDRTIEKEDKDHLIQFGSGRGTMQYGTCSISIPHSHKIGELESPSIFKLEFRENPEKHIVLLDVSVLDKQAYFEKLKAKDSALIFIHGYNVSFEDAARRTGQMKYDLQFPGPAIFYSWPSAGNKRSYTIDEQNIEWSQPHIKQFLEDVIEQTDVKRLYLVGHSMGTRGLTRALINLFDDNPLYRTRIKDIILAAPDIDADVFIRDIAPKITSGQNRVTLYASSRDLALAASDAVHGAPRAGHSGENLVVCDGVETVDASEVKTDFLGHSYFGDHNSTLSDIYYMIKEDLGADDRFGLQEVDSIKGRYWHFKK